MIKDQRRAPGWCARSPSGSLWADTFSLTESQSWERLEQKDGRTKPDIEKDGWSVCEVVLIVNPY